MWGCSLGLRLHDPIHRTLSRLFLADLILVVQRIAPFQSVSEAYFCLFPHPLSLLSAFLFPCCFFAFLFPFSSEWSRVLFPRMTLDSFSCFCESFSFFWSMPLLLVIVPFFLFSSLLRKKWWFVWWRSCPSFDPQSSACVWPIRPDFRSLSSFCCSLSLTLTFRKVGACFACCVTSFRHTDDQAAVVSYPH